MKIESIVEIPYGSFYKYEVDKKTNELVLDRVLDKYLPTNYGFVPFTLSEDGDALDIFIISNYFITPKTKVKVQIVSGYKCIDNGVEDNKLIGLLVGDKIDGHSFDAFTQCIEQYLDSYKQGFRRIEKVDEHDALILLKKAQDNYIDDEIDDLFEDEDDET